MKRSLQRMAVTIASIVLAGVALSAPAYADSGGGCGTPNAAGTSACISVHSGTTGPIWADFYIPFPTHNGEFTARVSVLEACTNGGITGPNIGYWLIQSSHSPSYSISKITCGSGQGSPYAITAVYLYKQGYSGSDYSYYVTSPKLFW